MATGRSMQLTRQIGEHLVAAELGRRGLVAAPFAGNVPLFDLLAADEHGYSIRIQVKAINGPSWQFSITQFLKVEVLDGVQHVRGRVDLPNPDLVCIFVLLAKTGGDTFYIFRPRDLQDHFASTFEAADGITGRRGPITWRAGPSSRRSASAGPIGGITRSGAHRGKEVAIESKPIHEHSSD